ncbi:hypothetical protein SAMN00790413_03645 [Deinococcus hopiensis KR-140]|uniref:Uncharacterized protein n=1 Tax=Deinococcus hopiensis KR-140 TaxID=695939 RepID=A0A1W1UZ55_9DEIO|nr:hypothetical protein SAMN00790413_03645 [Deinococcus hopiensis KR-140]
MFFEGGVQVLLQLLEDLLMLAVHPWATPSRALDVRQGAYLVFLQIQRNGSYIHAEGSGHLLMVLLLQRRCDNLFSKIDTVSACPDPLLHPLMMSNALGPRSLRLCRVLRVTCKGFSLVRDLVEDRREVLQHHQVHGLPSI